MDILLQVIGLSFIPLLAMLIFSGASDIYHGLKQYFDIRSFKISEMAFDQRAVGFVDNFGFRKLKTNFCKG